MSVADSLPPLTPEQAEHSARLTERIREEIEAHRGWISFERYMQMALYEPGLGYYSAGAVKLGPAGDFVTAPEISPLFSRCLANQCVDVFEHLAEASVLELGGGSGVMACDVLLELAAQGRLPQRYLILEVSADLRERQARLLEQRAPHLLNRVEWLDAWPQAFRGVVLANEVLDALPVHRFCMSDGQVRALGVTWRQDRLEWLENQADERLEAAVREIEESIGEPLPDGYSSEVNLLAPRWMSALAEALEQGVALFVDYGLPRREYYHRERSAGTLLCHFRHHVHGDPLINVGVQDIGAWVDFTAVAEAASAAGLGVAGFTTQAHFLIGAGIEEFMGEPGGEDVAARMKSARQAMQLTLPSEMGERFKVIGLTASYEHALRGFRLRDLAASL